MKTAKFNIDCDLGINYQDEPPWRSYQLTTLGDGITELIEEACISEVDQEGGDLACYGLNEASDDVREAAEDMILETLKKDFKNKHPLYETEGE